MRAVRFARALLVVDEDPFAGGIHRPHPLTALQLPQVRLRLLAIGPLFVGPGAFLLGRLLGLFAVLLALRNACSGVSALSLAASFLPSGAAAGAGAAPAEGVLRRVALLASAGGVSPYCTLPFLSAHHRSAPSSGGERERKQHQEYHGSLLWSTLHPLGG